MQRPDLDPLPHARIQDRAFLHVAHALIEPERQERRQRGRILLRLRRLAPDDRL